MFDTVSIFEIISVFKKGFNFPKTFGFSNAFNLGKGLNSQKTLIVGLQLGLLDTLKSLIGMMMRNLHMLKWATYSVSVIPPLPTSSMSKSLKPPGWAFETTKDALFMILTIEHYRWQWLVVESTAPV